MVLEQLNDGRVSEEVLRVCGVAPNNVLEEAVLVVPVVGEWQNELDACLASFINDLVQANKGRLVVDACRHKRFISDLL